MRLDQSEGEWGWEKNFGQRVSSQTYFHFWNFCSIYVIKGECGVAGSAVSGPRGVMALFRFGRAFTPEFLGIKTAWRLDAADAKRLKSGTNLPKCAGVETPGAADCPMLHFKIA
ncbi:MAG: hypothetical protein NTW80_09835 [Deltaproteobacteria bacterium]|nr:hypothetical protein [Deltaproteobacteria bacterium]